MAKRPITRSPASREQWPCASELPPLCETLSGLPSPSEHLATRLQFIADLLADAGRLPSKPLLLWRQADGSVRHALLGSELVVGRQPREGGIAMPEDKLLSRRHFVLREQSGGWRLLDLKSRNGTAINRQENRVRRRRLHDGDLVYAGSQIFVFLESSPPGMSS